MTSRPLSFLCRTLGLLVLAASVAALPSCGNQGTLKKGAGANQAKTLLENVLETYKKAAPDGGKRNLKQLKEIDDFVAAELAKDMLGDQARELAAWRPRLTAEIKDTWSLLVRDMCANAKDPAVVRQLIDYSTKMGADDLARPEPVRADYQPAALEHVAELEKALLTLEPGNAELRKKLGWVEADIDFEALKTTDFIDDDVLLDDLNVLKTQLESTAQKTEDGALWLPPGSTASKLVASVKDRVAAAKADFQKRMADPFQSEAWSVGQSAANDMSKILKNVSYTWTIRAFKPYVIIIERDKGWQETDVIQQKSEPLLELLRSFYESYAEVLGLKEIEKPVPVVIFKKLNAYLDYAKRRGVSPQAIGHFEHETGRLILSDETETDTLLHEGTHQIIAFNTSNASANFLARPYWFEEGIAEFFAASFRTVDPKTKAWRYEIGNLLQVGRLNGWQQTKKKAYKLYDLMGLTYRDRQKNTSAGDEDLNQFAYSQGWFLIYFLNNFDVDAEGVVKIGAPGKYKKPWLEFFKKTFAGRWDRDTLLGCLGMLKPDGKLDEAKFAVLEGEFNAYFEWVNRKIAMSSSGHIKERRLVPWTETVSRKGNKTGEKVDDMLKKPE